jgi:hypothetical protein
MTKQRPISGGLRIILWIALRVWLPLSPLVALNISIQQHKSSPFADGRNSPSHSLSHLLHQRKQPHMPLAILTPCLTMPCMSSADGQLRSRSIRQPVALSQFQRRRARRPKNTRSFFPNTAACAVRRRMGIHLTASTRRAGPLTLLLALGIALLPPRVVHLPPKKAGRARCTITTTTTTWTTCRRTRYYKTSVAHCLVTCGTAATAADTTTDFVVLAGDVPRGIRA